MLPTASIVGSYVIFTCFDALAAEYGVEIRALPATSPAFDDGEHGVVDLAAMVTSSWVVENTDDVVEDLVERDVRVFPCVENAGCDILEDSGGDLTGWFVKDVGEMVFGEKGVGRIGAVRVGPRFILVFSTCVNDGGAAGFELSGDSVDDRADKRGEEREDEERKAFCNLLNEGFKTRYLFDGCGDGFDNFVSEFENGVDLSGGFDRVKACAHARDTWAWGTALRAWWAGESCVNNRSSGRCIPVS